MLRLVRTQKGGELVRSERINYGGSFTFWERLTRNVVGSSKVIYESGIEQFDLLNRQVEGEITYVNFEILPNGWIFRANRNQRLMTLGVKISDIKEINLIGFRIRIKRKHFMGNYEYRIVHRGELEIIFTGTYRNVNFSVLTGEYESLIGFFRGSKLRKIFNHSISLKEPESDLINLEELLDRLM